MNLNQLYYFRTVAKIQHFTRAAEELNISQPSLSYAMSSLEDELGAYLFEKQGRNIALTKYGKDFYVHVEKALSELDEGISHIHKLTSESQGRVDLGYLYPLAPRYIPKMVRSFLSDEENKNINFTFYQGITSELIDGLKSQKYDMVFCSYVKDEPDITFIPVIQQTLVAVVPLNHPLASCSSVSLKTLEEYPMVVYHKDTGLGALTRDVFNKAGISPQIVSEGQNEQALYGFVSENFGISLVADIPEIEFYQVKAIPIEEDLCKRDIFLAYMKNQYLSPSAKKFAGYAKTAGFDI